MSTFEYSRWDGTQAFSPQSADELFDHLSQYMLEYGDNVLDNLDRWEEEHPDLIELLKKQGYIEKDEQGRYRITPRGLRRVETKSLEQLFDVRRKDQLGKHDTQHRGVGQTVHEESKPYEFGDPVANLNLHETLRNALQRRGAGTPVEIAADDLVVFDTEYQTNCATVVLIDMSGSMSRFGKYAQAKRVALALQALVRGRYQGDFLQFVGFYSYASPMTERQLLASAPKQVSLFDPYVHLRVNIDHPPKFVPQHFTNIQAGLQFARKILSKQPTRNKQIVTITDGEPTAHLEGRDVLLIYPPSEKTARATLVEARRCANEGIHLASFALIDDYFYLDLVNFVQRMAEVSGGVAAYCNAEDLGNMVIESFQNGRRKRRPV